MRVCSQCHLLLADADSVCPHDGAELRPVDIPPVPAALHEKFSNVEPFARGQTGSCYLATQKQSSYRGVLKVISLAGVEASERVRLKRELRKQTQLMHDGLARIIDGGEIGQQIWLFREHINGESLTQRLLRVGKLEIAEALTVTAQVASSLDELQRNGLLHRDVKPGHIILQGAPESAPFAKLIDAGIAARLPTGSVFGLLGTPAYISPEQVAGKLVSFRSDLYALGCVLFEMLSGKPPFMDQDVQAVLEAHKSQQPPELALELPHQARTVLQALLAKEPRQRPFSAQQVRRTLEPLLPPGTRLPALGTRAPAREKQPATRRAAARESKTEELELDDLSIVPEGPSTLHLTDRDLQEIAVSDDGPKTQHLTDLDLSELEVADESGASKPLRAAGGGDAVRDAVAHDPEHPTGAMPRIGAPSAGDDDAGAAGGRRSIDFDVESLFSEANASGAHPVQNAANVQTGIRDAAPTQIYRGRNHQDPASQLAPSPPGAPGDLAAAATADPDGTVMTARPNGRKLVPWTFAVAVLLLGALMLNRVRHRAEPVADKKTPVAVAAPAVEPPQPEKLTAVPTGGGGGSPAELTARAKSEAATGNPAEASAQPKTAPPQGAGPTVKAEAPAAEKPAFAEQAEAPAPVNLKPVAGVLPATTASAAELSAANAAGRKQTGAGDAKLAQPPGPREDRVAKAEEFKAQGRDAYQAGRFKEAAAAYEKATQQNPSDPGAFAGLGASRSKAGDPNAAVQAYSRAVKLQPDKAGFHAALGRAYLEKGDRDRARSAYQHALELDPKNAAAKVALEQLK